MTPLDDIKHGIAVLLQGVIGALFMLSGLVLVVWEFKTPPAHSAHVYLGVGLSVFGAALIPSIGPAVMSVMKGFVDALVKLIPFRTAK